MANKKQVIVMSKNPVSMRCAGLTVGVYTQREIDLAVKVHRHTVKKKIDDMIAEGVAPEDIKLNPDGFPAGIHPNMVGHRKRKGCGYDVTSIIEKLPFDGDVHEIACPQCGNVISVRRTAPEPPDDDAADVTAA